MKIEFESVLFGLAFLVLALISMPKNPDTNTTPDAASQNAVESATAQTAPASGQ